jgi:PIN domain nuclease of toxin-antitoxin system
MRALLDTHVFLWAALGVEQLSEHAHDLIEDKTNELLFSAASAYEIAVKVALGRLTLPEPVDLYVPSRIAAFGYEPLMVDVPHALRAAALPVVHRDPWDRLLVGQALIEGIPIITADPAIGQYGVETIW